MQALGYKTIGWVNMIRKNGPVAQEHFMKALELNPALVRSRTGWGKRSLPRRNLRRIRTRSITWLARGLRRPRRAAGRGPQAGGRLPDESVHGLPR